MDAVNLPYWSGLYAANTGDLIRLNIPGDNICPLPIPSSRKFRVVLE